MRVIRIGDVYRDKDKRSAPHEIHPQSFNGARIVCVRFPAFSRAGKQVSIDPHRLTSEAGHSKGYEKLRTGEGEILWAKK